MPPIGRAPRRVFTLALIQFVTVLMAIPTAAQNQPWEGPAFSAEPAAVLKAATDAPSADKQDSILLMHDEHFVLDSSGKRVQTHRLVVKLLTANAVRQWGSMEAQYQPWHEQRPQLNARVITNDGAVHSLDQKTISEAPVHAESDDLFSDSRIVRVPLPALAPGAVIEEEITFTDTAPMFDAGVLHRVYFGARIPVQRSRLTIDLPSTLPLKYEVNVLPKVSIKRSIDAGRLNLVFDNGPLEPIEQGEPFRPAGTPNWPQISFSIAKSWQDIASSYSKAVEEKITNADVKRFVDLAKSKKGRVEIVNSLIEQLHKDVRYTGIEFGESAFIPHLPSETLSRKYGDCKDKSALLVAMLRAAGIPAYLALLSTGPGEDTPLDIAGMGNFDHAIVFVPGLPDLWIDATAKYLRAGEIPSADQGRRALIVRPETTGLVLTPELPSSANRIVETREFYLSEDGPARVIETTETFGLVSSTYRGMYGGAETKELRKNLGDYVKSVYLADSLSKYEHGNAEDLSKPFFIRLEVDKAKRGAVDETEAVVATPLWGILNRLPAFMLEDNGPPPDPNKPVDPNAKYKVRKHELVLPNAFITEWDYKIFPSAGYKLRALPADVTQNIGPAVLSREYRTGTDGALLATIRFDTVKNHWSADEVESARQSIRDFAKQDTPFIYFDEIGRAALQAGKTHEALENYAKLAALHPKEALHHSQIALAYLAAGLGEAARQEADRAAKLEPTSAKAYKELGWILQHDLVGRRFRRGFDLAGAQAAFRKAVELDPDDAIIRANYAILLEYNSEGDRYASGAKLDEAIVQYDLLKKEKLEELNLVDNPLYDLMWASRFKDLKERLNTLPNTTARIGMKLIAIAGTDGAATAVQEATRLTSDDKVRSSALVSAGESLSQLRRYSLAAELVSAGAQGSENRAATLARAEILGKGKRYDESFFPESDPRRAVQLLIARMYFAPTVDESIFQLFSRYSLDEKAKAKQLKDIQTASRGAQLSFRANNLPLAVTADLLAAVIQFSVEGNDANGYRIHVQYPGAPAQTYYLVREDGKYKVLENNSSLEAVGSYILLHLADNDLPAARHWLNWAREEQKLGGGDDSLSGQPFPYFWTKGQQGDRDAVRYAAAALAAFGSHAEIAVPVLLEGRAKAKSDAERLHYDLALSEAYAYLKKFDERLPIAKRLFDSDKTSVTALNILTTTLQATGKMTEAKQVAEERLKLLPDDIDALRSLEITATIDSRPKDSQEFGRRIIALGKATANEFNNIAWEDLVMGKVTGESLETARRGVAFSENKDAAVLHTLAALYAEQGKTNEARDIILQTMDVWGLDEPNGACWYVYGRIAEEYNVPESAINAYKRVDAPEISHLSGGSTYELAQRRLGIITKSAAPKSTSQAN